jgi:4-amino-4-deoxy-L-arabinose transferase-like glycosyltransferase
MQELEAEIPVERVGPSSSVKTVAKVPPSPSPSQSSSTRRLWLLFAAVVLTVLLAAALRWSLDHPYGVHWDESEYFNDVRIDVHRLQSGMLVKFAGRIMVKSWGRPPAFRILADPLLALFGFHTFTARLISLACFGFSIWFVYLLVKRVASQAAGALAALVFALSPEVVSASIFFGTDTSLYLATSAMLYFLAAIWSGKSERATNWIGLGLALGLGFLAKTSFIVIALPVLAFWLIASLRGKWNLSRPFSQWKAAALALGIAGFIAGPWWMVNARAAFAYGKYARGFNRNSLGSPSLGTGVRWLNTVMQCLLGHGLSLLLALLLIAFLVSVLRKRANLSSLQRAVLAACACAGLPIVCAQLSGTNHLLRHISPAMIPLAIASGILFESTGWAQSRALSAVAGALFCVQLGMLIAPVVSPNTSPVDLGFANGALPWRTMVRFDQWDWRPVRDLADGCGLNDPKISYLGNGRVFNKPAIADPWIARGTAQRGILTDFPDPTWLWRYENGPFDWRSVMDAAGGSDIVLTAPKFVGETSYKEDQDNQFNADFAARLSQDGRFRAAIPLHMGRFAPVEILVFVNKNLSCPAGASGSAAGAGGKFQ